MANQNASFKVIGAERPTSQINRRHFIYTSALAATALTTGLPSGMARPNYKSPNEKLAIACIGLGGQGHSVMNELVNFQQDIVAVCDVDEDHIQATRKSFDAATRKANVYQDFRKLLEHEKSADAVLIATPDHWHAMLCTAAIHAGKHVYCEKPLTHTVGEARQLGHLARHSKVVTQTGNQGSGSSHFRRSIELVQAGVLGSVRDIYIWHPPHGWPCGIERPIDSDPVPEGLDWDWWLGPAPTRPYKKGMYHPFNWRGWYDFGGGSLADFTCHAFSMPTRALELNYPTKIKVSGVGLGQDSFPKSCQVHFIFPAREKLAPVSIHFYTGGEMPRSEVTAGMAETFNKIPTTGCLLVGDKGALSAGLWNNECYLKMNGESEYEPAANHEAAKGVPQSLPRAPQDRHVLEWVGACKGKGRTFSPFEFGGHVTEIGAAGVLALRLGHDINWDGQAMKAKGEPAAPAWVKPQQRKEWAV
jgi:predicted dehydrogenase